jgi:hypothetical protein
VITVHFVGVFRKDPAAQVKPEMLGVSEEFTTKARRSHKEAQREYFRAYYEKHREEIIANTRRNYRKNWKARNEYRKKYYEANLEQCRAYYRAYKEKHRARLNAIDRARYYSRKSPGAYTGKCAICKKKFTRVRTDGIAPRFCTNACAIKSRAPSSFQLEVFKEVKVLFPDALMEYKVGRWSVDIFVPDRGVCIEADGWYWHTQKKSRLEKDKLKDLELEQLGYRVIRVPELQWRKDRNIFRYI